MEVNVTKIEPAPLTKFVAWSEQKMRADGIDPRTIELVWNKYIAPAVNVLQDMQKCMVGQAELQFVTDEQRGPAVRLFAPTIADCEEARARWNAVDGPKAWSDRDEG
jgi:hypothetical protein